MDTTQFCMNSVKCFPEINKVIEQVHMGFKMLFYKGFDNFNLFIQYLYLFRNPAFSSDIIHSSWGVSLLSIIFSNILIEWHINLRVL